MYVFSPENLDVRLGYNLCEEEQDFLQKRKKVVASALKKVLQLRRDLHEHEVCESVSPVTRVRLWERKIYFRYGESASVQFPVNFIFRPSMLQANALILMELEQNPKVPYLKMMKDPGIIYRVAFKNAAVYAML